MIFLLININYKLIVLEGVKYVLRV